MKTFFTSFRSAVPAWAVNGCGLIGAVLFLAGVVCFFAYNWQYMGAALKLTLPLLGLLACAYGAYRKGLASGAGQVCSVACGLFLGIFFAVYGQVFQTGAFVYEFFSIWALCLLPLAVLAGNRWLWLLWAAVVNGYILSVGYDRVQTFWVPLCFNALCFVLAEVAFYKTKRGGWFSLFFLVPTLLACVVYGGWRLWHIEFWLSLGGIVSLMVYAALQKRGAGQLGLCALAFGVLGLYGVADWLRPGQVLLSMLVFLFFTVSALAVYAFTRKGGKHD